MKHELPKLPYEMNALEPFMSRETLEYHYGKHHQAYVNKLNELIPGSPFENATLEEIIKKADGAIFNNGAQIWNHTFFWHCLQPAKDAGAAPQQPHLHEDFKAALDRDLGGMDKFKENFTKTAIGLFGSGWTWLCKDEQGRLSIVPCSNAENPLRKGLTPLLTLDVWEHAYYIDYRNARPKFVDAYWNLVNWAFVQKNFTEGWKSKVA